MNNSVRNATGAWLLCMNASDEFTSPHRLSAVTKQTDENTDMIDSDGIDKESCKTIQANFDKLNVRHLTLSR